MTFINNALYLEYNTWGPYITKYVYRQYRITNTLEIKGFPASENFPDTSPDLYQKHNNGQKGALSKAYQHLPAAASTDELSPFGVTTC
jgi:hypothetical protein